jgi:hypothetical protein
MNEGWSSNLQNVGPTTSFHVGTTQEQRLEILFHLKLEIWNGLMKVGMNVMSPQ